MSLSSTSTSDSPRIVVVGSINMDLVVPCARLPRPGETVFGETLHEVPGGKGANQAVAAARLGARVSMVGRVGGDAFATTLRRHLEQEGVQVDFVQPTVDTPSGVAIVSVDSTGENSITIIPGANAKLTPDDVTAAADGIRQADLLMLQLEIPLPTVLAAIDLAKQFDIPVLLDPAPAPATCDPRLLQVDLLCPNELETEAITQRELTSDESIEQATRQLHASGARTAIITLGSRGAVVCEETGNVQWVPACKVDAVDSTAAGDAFAAALAVQIAIGRPVRDAVAYGCAAGALAASRLGAQVSMPTAKEVDELLATVDHVRSENSRR